MEDCCRKRKYRALLDQFGMTASMSRKGNCYDNAPMESFWGTLKNERIHDGQFSTRQEAVRKIREQRKQARLNYLSPAAFERQFYEKQEAA